MGWGATREGDSIVANLNRVDVPVVADATCKAAYTNLNPLTPTMICAGSTGKDACQGDSGGPLILEQPNRDVLVGIVSWGIGCGRTNYPGVYSKVSYVKSWIQATAPTAQWV